MSWHRQGELGFVASQESVAPVELRIARPITRAALVLDGEQTSGTGGTLVEDSTMNIERQIFLRKGGNNVQTIGNGSALGSGGKMLDITNRVWLRNVPHFGAAGVSGTNVLRHSLMMPISVPQELYPEDLVDRTALRIPGDTWTIQVRWGALADLLTGGSGYAITAADTEIEVYVEVDDGLSPDYPEESFFMRTVPTVNALDAAGGDEVRLRLNRNGEVMFHALLAYNNSLRSDAVITRLKYLLDSEEVKADVSWFMAQHIAEAIGDAPGNLPVGNAGIDFDQEHNFKNLVDAIGAEGWDVDTDHTTTTGTARLHQQVYYVSPREI